MQGFRSKGKVTASHVTDVCYSVRMLQSSATALEYALMVVFVATVTVLAVGLLGQQLIPGFQAVTAGL